MPDSAVQRPQSFPPVAYVELLRAIHFTERAPERRIVEQRIVSKSARPACFAKDLPFHFTAKRLPRFTAFRQRDHAYKSPGAVRRSSPNRSSSRRLFAASSASGPAYRAEYTPGAPPSASTCKPRIIRKKWPRRKSAVIFRLQPGVLFKRGAVSSGAGIDFKSAKGSISMPSSSPASRNSRSFPGLPVAQ